MSEEHPEGRWLGQIKGWNKGSGHFEATVVREDNAHGRGSWGWIGPHKVLVMEGTASRSAWISLGPLIKKAVEDLAAKFNREEGRQ